MNMWTVARPPIRMIVLLSATSSTVTSSASPPVRSSLPTVRPSAALGVRSPEELEARQRAAPDTYR